MFSENIFDEFSQLIKGVTPAVQSYLRTDVAMRAAEAGIPLSSVTGGAYPTTAQPGPGYTWNAAIGQWVPPSGGLSTTTLLLIGGGILVLFLFMKKKPSSVRVRRSSRRPIRRRRRR